jgi:folylpolyglutamate synthase/dihydropteroate synthase
VRRAESPEAAARAIVAADARPARLLICGSLYLAGEILARNG